MYRAEHLAVVLEKSHRRLLDERTRQSGHHPDREPALLLAAYRIDGILDLSHAGEDATDLVVQPHRMRGWSEPSLHTIKQLQPGVELEMGDQLAHRRLRHVEELGRAADRAVLDDRLERLDLAKIDLPRHP